MTSRKQPGAVELLKEDHRKVKDLFKKFESAKDESEKDQIADEVDLELRVHSMIEEEILYPAMRDVDSEMVAEAFEEHGVVEELLNELATMELGDEQFDAKFKVMQENVEHHIEEEEGDLFPKTSKLPGYEDLGFKLVQRKVELMEELKMKGDASERATSGAQPATMLASEKSESVLEGASSPPPASEPARKRSGSSSRSQRAAATSGRSRRR
jgi:hypothetical protein